MGWNGVYTPIPDKPISNRGRKHQETTLRKLIRHLYVSLSATAETKKIWLYDEALLFRTGTTAMSSKSLLQQPQPSLPVFLLPHSLFWSSSFSCPATCGENEAAINCKGKHDPIKHYLVLSKHIASMLLFGALMLATYWMLAYSSMPSEEVAGSWGALWSEPGKKSEKGDGWRWFRWTRHHQQVLQNSTEHHTITIWRFPKSWGYPLVN